MNTKQTPPAGLKKAIFTIVTLGFVLALVIGTEALVRAIWTPPWEKTALGTIDPAVFAEYSVPKPAGKPYEGKYIRHNSHGFRNDEEFSFTKPADEYRIVYLGASVAYGAWSTSRATATQGILEKCLVAPGKKLKVLSLSESGAEAADELLWLTKLGFRLQPDLVISLTGYNDLFYSALFPDLWDKGSGSRGYARPGTQSPLRENTFRAVKTSLFELLYSIDRLAYGRIRSYQLLKHVLRIETREGVGQNHAARMKGILKDEAQAKAAAESAVTTWARIKTLLEEKKIPSVFFFQPVFGCSGAKAAATAQAPSVGARDRDPALCEALRTSMPTGLMVDLSQLVGAQLENQASYMDPVHLDDKGFEVVGKAMCRELAAAGLGLKLREK